MVKFIGALQHAKENGYYTESDGFKEPPKDILIVLSGRKEYVVTGDENIIHQLKALPATSFLGHKMKDIKKYLDTHGIPYEVAGEASKI